MEKRGELLALTSHYESRGALPRLSYPPEISAVLQDERQMPPEGQDSRGVPILR